MKLATILPLAAGLGVGYVLGAAAGRGRYQQIKSGAAELARHPKVQQTLFDLADQVTSSSHRLPGPAADFVSATATRLEDRMTRPAAAEEASDPGVPAAAPSAAQAGPPLS